MAEQASEPVSAPAAVASPANPSGAPLEQPQTQYRWESVYDLLADTAAGMAPGRMLHTAEFSLQTTLTALEIMEPKMDGAMHTAEIPTLGSESEKGLVPLDPTLEQSIAIMDELVIRERQWLSGSPASCSLFACLYLQQPELVRTPELASLLRGAKQMAAVVHKAIVKADCYEDEDWNPRLDGLELEDPKLSNKHVAVELLALEKRMEDEFQKATEGKLTCAQLFERQAAQTSGQQQQGASAGGGSKNKKKKKKGAKAAAAPPAASAEPAAADRAASEAPAAEPPVEDSLSQDARLRYAVWLRARARRLAFLVHAQMSQPACAGFTAARAAMDQLMPVFPVLAASVREFAEIQVPGFVESLGFFAGFPNRKPTPFTRAEALSDWQTTALHLRQLQELETLCSTGVGLELRWNALLSYAAQQPPFKNIVVRAHHALMIADKQQWPGDASLADLVQEDLVKWVPVISHALGKPLTNSFLTRVIGQVDFKFKVLALNQSRLRARIPNMLMDWGVLQLDAQAVDNLVTPSISAASVGLCLRRAMIPYPITSWPYQKTLDLILLHVGTSLDQQLFHPRELPYVYWLLAIMHQNRVHNLRALRADPAAVARRQGASAQQAASDTWVYHQEVANQVMALGNAQLLARLLKHGCLADELGSAAHGSLRLMYTRRFQSLVQAPQPAFPAFEDFEAHSSAWAAQPQASAFEEITGAYRAAAAAIDAALQRKPPSWVQEQLRAQLQVAKANESGFQQISQSLSEDVANKVEKTKLRLRCSFAFTRRWPILSLGTSKKHK